MSHGDAQLVRTLYEPGIRVLDADTLLQTVLDAIAGRLARSPSWEHLSEAEKPEGPSSHLRSRVATGGGGV